MNAVCFIVVVMFISCYGNKTNSQKGSYTLKLENANYEELRSMLWKIKGTGQGMREHEEKFSAFAASLTDPKTLGAGQIVKFNKVWTNINNDYHPSTGVYTAPIAGVYQFACTVMTPYSKTLRVFLWKNNTQTVAIYPGDSGHNMGTLNMILELKKGDKVYIRQGRGEKYIHSQSTSNFSMFSGYLIR
ncbi:complement C1q tumor necrosis factor-related protein 6 [Mytilus galloprovincialis]|uniref:Complement C1q tumor necrosis factor-related protein 6 n=1 Tax=Mytilus galloprovincialis TaxID=29158 RepID=A0A8B6H827_MYTGA|nr:complement C1q tumor necrosis factor-related protein 6 [Mytilus galloprovincialis]